MLMEFSWKAFEETGSIDAYIFFKEIEEKKSILIDSKAATEEVAVSN